jgi:hypothetical protein
MSMRTKVAVLGESSDFNFSIAVPGGPAKRATRIKSSTKKNRKSRGARNIIKADCHVASDEPADENAAQVYIAAHSASDAPASGPPRTTKAKTSSENKTKGIVPTSSSSTALSGIHEAMNSGAPPARLVRSASVHNVRSPAAVLSPRRHSCDAFVQPEGAHSAATIPACNLGSARTSANSIGIRLNRQAMHGNGTAGQAIDLPPHPTTAFSSMDFRASTPSRPKRVGGGYMSPSLASPPHEIAASKAAQDRINRRLSTTRAQSTADAASERLVVHAVSTNVHLLAAVAETPVKEEDSMPVTEHECNMAARLLPTHCTLLGEAAEDLKLNPGSISNCQTGFGLVAEMLSAVGSEHENETHLLIGTPAITRDFSCESSFISPVPCSQSVLATSFEPSPFIAPEMIDQTHDTTIEASDVIQNSVTMPFTLFQQAVEQNGAGIPTVNWYTDSIPSIARVVECNITEERPHCVQMFSPSTVLERSGHRTPLASPLPASTDSTVAIASVTVPVATLSAQLGLDISIERTQLRGGFWDRFATYTIRTRVFEGAQVKQEAIVERRFREFEAFWERMQAPGCAQHDADFMQSLVHERLRAAIKLQDLPSKVAIAPWRDAVVESRASTFRKLMLTVSSGCAGIKHLSSIPGWMLEFLNIPVTL